MLTVFGETFVVSNFLQGKELGLNTQRHQVDWFSITHHNTEEDMAQ